MSPARSHPHGFARILAGCAALLLSAAGFAQSPTPAPTAAPDQDGIVLLPRMTVVGQSLNEFPLFPKADVTPPDFSGTAGPSDLFYPSRANYEGIFEGKATVGVMLDDKGNPTDYLVIRYTEKYFGESLLREAHEQQFAPRKVKGVAVPGRFEFGYRFVPNFTIAMNSFNAIEQRALEIEGGPRFVYEPHPEGGIDGGKLEFKTATVPFIPDGVEVPKGKTLQALVTFFVDETGHVRLPSVESAESPLLIPNAIKAVSHWVFKPPTLAGKPVLVFTGRSVAFVEFIPAAPPAPRPPAS